MAQMAEISSMQMTLAHRVQASMARIDSRMLDPVSDKSSTADEGDDVEAWRNKIALLSAPVGQPTTEACNSAFIRHTTISTAGLNSVAARTAPSVQLVSDEKHTEAEDEEDNVEAWRAKIALLSAPVLGQSPTGACNCACIQPAAASTPGANSGATGEAPPVPFANEELEEDPMAFLHVVQVGTV